MASADLPSISLLQEQAGWLAPARRWLLEQASLTDSRRTLDLGCGFGVVSGELAQSAGGPVLAVDYQPAALLGYPQLFSGAHRACANARALPFPAAAFDLVFCQLALLWMPLERTLAEIHRVLAPGGRLVAIEPDYGGMIEYPPATAAQDIWLRALRRAGADPLVGRKLPGALARLGFTVQVNLFNELHPPAANRFALLEELPLTPLERVELDQMQSAAAALPAPWQQIAHLPFMLVTAQKMIV